MGKAVSALLIFLLCAATPATAQTTNYQICFSKFALCTMAKCAYAGDGNYSCACTVMTDYSLGEKPCESTTEPQWKNGQLQIRSRYYPLVSYGVCPAPKDINWANCLDAWCTVEPNNPSAATCTCPIGKDSGSYIVGASNFNQQMCGQAISSAPASGAQAITKYLQSNNPYMLPVPTPNILTSQ